MKNNKYDTKYIKVLDGIRAFAILIIVWFHFWQQSWLNPKIGSVYIDFIPRYGFLLVDMMILLSSFCLFIPYARAMVYKEKIPDTKKFYIKRIARIFPSYYLALIISFIALIILKNNWFNTFFIKDTLMHIFFVNNWSTDTLVYTNYITALWTIALEVQFYLLFPFIAKRFVKKPVHTYTIMMVIGIVCSYIIQKNINTYNLPFFVNHFLTFIPVYANGMLAAWFYMSYTKGQKRNTANDLFFMVVSISAIIAYTYLSKSIGTNNVQVWQIKNRLLLSFVFTIFVVSTCLSSKIYQKIYDNRFTRYIAFISLNLYIYHAFIAVTLKQLRIPYYSGDVPPNMTGDTAWQWTYTIICIILSLAFAGLITNLVEKPISKYIRKKYKCDE